MRISTILVDVRVNKYVNINECDYQRVELNKACGDVCVWMYVWRFLGVSYSWALTTCDVCIERFMRMYLVQMFTTWMSTPHLS